MLVNFVSLYFEVIGHVRARFLAGVDGLRPLALVRSDVDTNIS